MRAGRGRPRAPRPARRRARSSASPASTAWCISRARLGALLRAQRLDDGAVEQPHAGAPAGCSRSRAAPARGGSRARRGAPRSPPPARPRPGRSSSSPSSSGGQLGRDVRGHHGELLERRRGSRRRAPAAREHRVLDAGRAPRRGGAASASVTKNGLPPVSACTAAGSRPLPAASAAPPPRESGDSSSRCTGQPGERRPAAGAAGGADRARRRGRSGRGRRRHAARRAAPRSRARRGWRRRPSGRPRRRARWAAARRAPPAARRRPRPPGRPRPAPAASGPSRPAAASRSGPSVRGATRSSHAAVRSRARAADRAGECAHEAGLADARLAGDQRRRAVPLRGLGHGAEEDLELRVSLEQDLGHHHMVTDAGIR